MRNAGNVFAQSVARNFEDALELLEAALTDCPGRLGETNLWPDGRPWVRDLTADWPSARIAWPK